MAEEVDSTTKNPAEEKMVEGIDFRFIMQKKLAKNWAGSNAKVLFGSRYIKAC